MKPFWKKNHGAAVKVSRLSLPQYILTTMNKIFLLSHAVNVRVKLDVVLVNAAALVNIQPKKVGH